MTEQEKIEALEEQIMQMESYIAQLHHGRPTDFAAMEDMLKPRVGKKLLVFPEEAGGTIRVRCNDEMIDFIFDKHGKFKYLDARDPWH